MAHDVFVSYSTYDKATADAVCALLEGRGVRCWIAPRDILPGVSWAEAIIDAIEASRVMVLVFSARANASQQIQREVERAVHNGVTIIPLRIEDAKPSKTMEYFISTPHWLDALTPPLESHIQRLADGLKTLLSRPDTRLEAAATAKMRAYQGPGTGVHAQPPPSADPAVVDTPAPTAPPAVERHIEAVPGAPPAAEVPTAAVQPARDAWTEPRPEASQPLRPPTAGPSAAPQPTVPAPTGVKPAPSAPIAPASPAPFAPAPLSASSIPSVGAPVPDLTVSPSAGTAPSPAVGSPPVSASLAASPAFSPASRPAPAATTSGRPFGLPLSGAQLGAVAVAALVVVAVIVGLLMRRPAAPPSTAGSPASATSVGETATATPAAGSATTADPGAATATPSSSAATLTAVTVDAAPWARVSIRPVAGGTAPAGDFVTPLSIQLAPGDYDLLLENGGVTPSHTHRVKVAANQPNAVRVTMPGFEAAKVVQVLRAGEAGR